ncbi:MAG: hypothetical protein E6Q24_07860 [Chitinophagaceae bacterium]|nr:MAG: hypothetical protein E6Q24_07860 [Chitinophagaceae bacterium]
MRVAMPGEDFELLVKRLLEEYLNKSSHAPIIIEHRKKLKTADGIEYEIDLFFKTFASGLEYWNLVECKCWDQPVKRDMLNAIIQKRDELHAHKVIVVSKKGFQAGAIELAQKHRVALIKVTDDRSLEYISHADGNLSGYIEFILQEATADLAGKACMVGIVFPSIDIFEFIGARCGKEISRFIKSREFTNFLDVQDRPLPPEVRRQLEILTPELLKEYEYIETCGLSLKLMNEPELRTVHMAALLLKTL